MFLCLHRYANLIIDKAMRTIVVVVVVYDIVVGFFFRLSPLLLLLTYDLDKIYKKNQNKNTKNQKIKKSYKYALTRTQSHTQY